MKGKIYGALGAVTVLIAGAPAIAQDVGDPPFYCTEYRADLIEWVEEFARFTRCVDYPSNVLPGQWNPDDPVWQHRPKQGGDGCEVHWKVSRLIDEATLEYSNPDRKGKNGNRGAASELEDGKDTDAYDSLQEFIDTLNYSAVVATHVFEDGTEHDHQALEDAFVSEARDIQECIGRLRD